MTPTTKNLKISWLEEAPDPWPEGLTSLLEGYPFERRYRDRLGNDVARTRWELDQQDLKHAVMAQYGDRCVGWLQVHEPFPGGPLWVRNERLQRNRPDLRIRLLDELSKRFGDRSWVLSQPTQNRTARQELARFSGISLLSLSLAYVRPRTALKSLEKFPQNPPVHPLVKGLALETVQAHPPVTQGPGFKTGSVYFERPLGQEASMNLYLGSVPSNEPMEQAVKKDLVFWLPQHHPLRERTAEGSEPTGKRAFFFYDPDRRY